tara:strand:- start:1234 stop:1956 length:723 start_codon:yes stop_codon:yes gene_type:complete
MIKLSKCGCLARVKKQNEIIKALNPLLRLEMRYGDKLQTHYSDNNVVLEIPNLELLSLALEDIQAEASSHPWKVTDEGSGTVAIAAGYITGYYLYYPDSNPNTAPSGGPGNYGPDAITLGPASTYSGSVGNAVTGTKYIYAESPRNGTTKSNEYSETYFTGTPNVLIELFDDIKPVSSDTAAIVISSDAPDSYHSAATSPTKAAVCLAKVVNTDGFIAVTTYITHNPTIFLPTPQVNTAV